MAGPWNWRYQRRMQKDIEEAAAKPDTFDHTLFFEDPVSGAIIYVKHSAACACKGALYK